MKKETIFVIDSMKSVIMKTSTLFKNYYVRGGSDGIKCLDEIKKYRPALIITELELEGISGMDLCMELSKDESTKNIPIMLLSGIDGDEIIQQALDAGFDEFLNKNNYSDTKLVMRATHLLKSAALLQKQKEQSDRFESALALLRRKAANNVKIVESVVSTLDDHYELKQDKVAQKCSEELREITEGIISTLSTIDNIINE